MKAHELAKLLLAGPNLEVAMATHGHYDNEPDLEVDKIKVHYAGNKHAHKILVSDGHEVSSGYHPTKVK